MKTEIVQTLAGSDRFVGVSKTIPMQNGITGTDHVVGVNKRSAAHFNPNGIVSLSPGLRGTSYPGCMQKREPTPTGLCLRFSIGDAKRIATTPLGLADIVADNPR